MTSPASDSGITTVISVRMGELVAGTESAAFKTLLGSCIGLAVYDRTARIGGLAHVMLPSSVGHDGPPGKFVDTAVAELIEQVEQLGGQRRRLLAKIAGGARMFSTNVVSTIGDQNLDAVLNELKQQSIPVAGSHCGGTQGRRMTFLAANGKVSIYVIGAAPVEI